MTDSAKARPVYRNIHVTQIVSYRLPPAGIVSILHRVSGLLMFMLLLLLLLLRVLLLLLLLLILLMRMLV